MTTNKKRVYTLIGIGISAVVIASIIMLSISVKILDPNEVGLDLDTLTGTINANSIYTGGRHFLGLGHEFVVFPRTIQNLAFPPMIVRSSEGVPISVAINLQYQLPHASVDNMVAIYKYFQKDYEAAMRYLIDGLVRDVCANFTTYDFSQNRGLLQTAMENYIDPFFVNLYIHISAFQVVDIQLPTAFTKEIENTATAIRDSDIALNERTNAIVQFDTLNATVQSDIAIANLNRDTTVFNLLTNANNTADTLISIYRTEATALATIKLELGLTNNELLAYFFVKTLQNSVAKLYLSVGINPTLL